MITLMACVVPVHAVDGVSGAEKNESAQPAAPYLILDARVLVVDPAFAEKLGLDPSPVEQLMKSDATLVRMPELAGQMLSEAAAESENGRLLLADPAAAKSGQAMSLLLAPAPTFIAMPEPVDPAETEPKVTCVLRATVDDDTVSIHMAGVALGGVDLAGDEADGTNKAEMLEVPSVRFSTDLIDGEFAMLALPFDLTELFAPQPAPANTVTLLLIRATVVRDGVI